MMWRMGRRRCLPSYLEGGFVMLKLAEEPTCVLVVVSRMLMLMRRSQIDYMLAGEYARMPYAGGLVRLLWALRATVCTETRNLDETETPDLSGLLATLPQQWREEIEWAVAAEQAGRVAHGPRSRREAADLVLHQEPAGPLAEADAQQIRLVRSAVRRSPGDGEPQA